MWSLIRERKLEQNISEAVAEIVVWGEKKKMQIAIFPSAPDRIVREDYSNVTRCSEEKCRLYGCRLQARHDHSLKTKTGKKNQMGREYTVLLFYKFCFFSLALHASEIGGPGGELWPEHLQDDYPHS